MSTGGCELSAVDQDQAEVYPRLGKSGIERGRFLKCSTRRFRVAKTVERLTERIVRLRRARQQTDRFRELRNRFGALSVLHQHGSQHQPGIGIARIGSDDSIQDLSRLLALALG